MDCEPRTVRVGKSHLPFYLQSNRICFPGAYNNNLIRLNFQQIFAFVVLLLMEFIVVVVVVVLLLSHNLHIGKVTADRHNMVRM